MRVAIITGASSGIGKEFVKQLDNNYNVNEVYVIARRKEKLEELQSYTKAKVFVLQLDLTKEESLEEYKNILQEKKPQVELLVNAAGFGMFDEFINSDYQINNNMVNLNCRALQAITYMTIPYILEGGKIVQLASMSSVQPVPYIGLYAATKAFVLSLSRSLNIELRKRKIKVLALIPYWVKTDFFDVANKKNIIKRFDVIYTPEFIIKKCYKALNKNKDVCIPGKYAKFQYALVKILPHKLVMSIWLKQQKIK